MSHPKNNIKNINIIFGYEIEIDLSMSDVMLCKNDGYLDDGMAPLRTHQIVYNGCT
jgi:hypothetical protein